MFTSKKSWLLAFVTLAVPVAAVHADTLAQKEKKAKVETAVQNDAKIMNGACGTSMQESVDWTTWGTVTDDQMGSHGIAGLCMDLPQGVQNVCGSSADAKAAVQGKIKKLVCAYGKQQSIVL